MNGSHNRSTKPVFGCAPRPLLLLTVSWLIACEDPLVDPATVIGPRIVAARTRATTNPASAEPRAGETASIDWLVLSDRAGSFAASFAWCVAEPSSLGVPSCARAPFAEQSAEGVFGEPLSLEFTLPTSLEAGDAWLVWLGSCAEGGAVFDAGSSAFSCLNGATPQTGFYRGRVPHELPNENPLLADDELSLDGLPWLAPDGLLDPGAPCSTLGAQPNVRAGDTFDISFALDGDDREELPLDPDEYAPHARESLVYTHLASVSGLERAFSAIDFDATALGFTVPFAIDADEDVAPEGEIINFHLLVRDERGGVDWTRRDACLLPAASGGT